MHELSLFAQIPLSRHGQVLNILAGLSSMSPVEVYTRHAIFQPLKTSPDGSDRAGKKKAASAHQPQQLYLFQLVRELQRDDDFGKADTSLAGPCEDTVMDGHEGQEQPGLAPEISSKWTLKIQETPEPETKTLTLRRVTEETIRPAEVRKHLDPSRSKQVVTMWLPEGVSKVDRLSDRADRFLNEYVTEGHRCVYNDTALHLHRYLAMPPQLGTHAMRTTLPPLADLIPVDPSGAFLLQATVRVEDRSKPALVHKATEQLLALKSELRGAVDLVVPERLSMDTRIKDS